MTRGKQLLVVCATLLSAAVGRSALCESQGLHAKFVAPNGDAIELDTRSGTLRAPRSQRTTLQDCGDKYQFCLTDNRGFAFAYFRDCNDAVGGGHKRLTFRPHIVSVLHGNLWLVFSASPTYMFHYVDSKGIIGIYVGPTPSFDFRRYLHDRTFRVASLDAMEYRIASSDTVAACRE